MSLPAKTMATVSERVNGAAVSAIQAVLFGLSWLKYFVAWLTITLPRLAMGLTPIRVLRDSLIVRMLHYTLTISLGFTSILLLVLATLAVLLALIRYRYLTRYTKLKETALPPASPPIITADLLPLPTSEDSRRTPFRNYLDDFLSAIRIFGYLEKPVFHELSRHLQTRRLASGESIEIGGGDFWCVVEGNVQVVSRTRI